MSKLVYICLRSTLQTAAASRALQSIGHMLTPDNLQPAPTAVRESGGILFAIFNPSSLVRVDGRSVCAGYLVGNPEWEHPLTGRPEGAYALFRADDHHVELVADELASRSVWYVKTDEVFIASTSQRAIVALMGSFEFNPDIVPWMLATGILGPGHSWDRRIKHLDAASSVSLDRNTWTMTTKVEPLRIAPLNAPDADHERRLRAALDNVVGTASFDHSQWALALSGGVDSRGILCLLKNTAGLKAVTWGVRASLQKRNSDAHVARKLAEHFGLEHQYHETDLSAEPIERIFQRYLVCGEGRIDHLAGYMDGFRLWRTVYEGGIRGVIRGDEIFGWRMVASAQDVRASVGMPLWSDFRSTPPLEELGCVPQHMPEAYLQRPQESLDAWRDRLYQQYRVPFVLAALSDLKLSYVEIACPLLAGSLVEEIRKLPDHLRTNKALFRSIVRSLSPDVALAEVPAIESLTEILAFPRVVEFLREGLRSRQSDDIVPREFKTNLADALVTSEHTRRSLKWKRIKRSIRSHLPSWAAHTVTKMASRTAELNPNANQLAFRIHLIGQMKDMLTADARTVVA